MATSAKSPVRQKNKDCSSESSNVQIGIVHREAGLLLQHKPNPGHSLNPIQFKKNFFFFPYGASSTADNWMHRRHYIWRG